MGKFGSSYPLEQIVGVTSCHVGDIEIPLTRRHADISPRATVRYSEKMQLVHQMAVLRRINEMKWTLGY